MYSVPLQYKIIRTWVSSRESTFRPDCRSSGPGITQPVWPTTSHPPLQRAGLPLVRAELLAGLGTVRAGMLAGLGVVRAGMLAGLGVVRAGMLAGLLVVQPEMLAGLEVVRA